MTTEREKWFARKSAFGCKRVFLKCRRELDDFHWLHAASAAVEHTPISPIDVKYVQIKIKIKNVKNVTKI